MIEVKDGHHIFPGDVVMAEKKGSVNTLTLDSGKKIQVNDEVFEEVTAYEDTPELQNKTVTPSTSQQTVIADDSYQGLDTVTVEAVTSAIDPYIVAENIKKDVEILGVTGSYEGGSAVPEPVATITNTQAKYFGRKFVSYRPYISGNGADSWSYYTFNNPIKIKILGAKLYTSLTNATAPTKSDAPDATYTFATYQGSICVNSLCELTTENGQRYLKVLRFSRASSTLVSEPAGLVTKYERNGVETSVIGKLYIKYDYTDPIIKNNTMNINGTFYFMLSYDDTVLTTQNQQNVNLGNTTTYSNTYTFADKEYIQYYTGKTYIAYYQGTNTYQSYQHYMFLNIFNSNDTDIIYKYTK